MKRIALLLLVLMTVLAVPAWADGQVVGSGGRSPASTPPSGLIGSGT
jgi:hypothetical protein